MSHTKIAPKILNMMSLIPILDFTFLCISKQLIEQKLIAKTDYTIVESREKTDAHGVVWQFVTVSCVLTIIDTESDETLVSSSLGSGTDSRGMEISKAQQEAWQYAWLNALNILANKVIGSQVDEVVPEPEIIVETPESKLIAHIKALWKWDPALFPDYALQRFKRPIEQLNISELTVLKNELENYGR